MSKVKLKDLCFEIIQKCPNNCKFCSSNANYSRTNIIKFDDFKRTVEYLYNRFGIDEISISGGEPFLHPDLFRMIEYCKSLGIRTILFTSGVKKSSKLTQDEIDYLDSMRENDLEKVDSYDERVITSINKYYDNFLKPSEFSCISKEEFLRLKELGLDGIVFDYQADDGDIDNYLMGRSEVIRCLEDRSLYNASAVGLNIDIHFVPMKPNYREIASILETIEILKIPKISILKFVPQGRGKDNKEELLLSDEELLEFNKLVENSRYLYSGNIRISNSFDGVHECNAGKSKADIRYDGVILPCAAFKDTKVCDLCGIKYFSIYDDLSELEFTGEKRGYSLCKYAYSKVRDDLH